MKIEMVTKMSEDIHKWDDGRYTLMFDEHTFFVFDNEKKKEMTALQTTKKLNEQQSLIHKNEISIKTMISNMKKLEEKNKQLRNYNKQLKERLERINGGYGHLTHRNGLTANEWLIESQERELKKKNEQISDLKEENKRLRQTIQEVCELLAEAIHLFSDATIYLIPAIEKAIKLLKGGIDE